MKKIIVMSLILSTVLIGCQKNKFKNKKTNNIMNNSEQYETPVIDYKSEVIDGVKVAYREAGDQKNPTIVLLHGFPSSSHQYRKVFNALSNQYHLIAPDYPGFGNSDFPSPETYTYTFDNLAETIEKFLEKKNINSFAMMIQDYGAPIGFRIATAHPEKIKGIINQNGNVYEIGLGPAWAGIQAMWKDRNETTETALLPAFSLEGLKWQYTHGVRNVENINPDTWHLDYLRLSRPNAHKVNIDLFDDYKNNVTLYPKWQQYLRDYQPPMLIVWGKNDEFFPEAGAEAFKKDLKDIDYNLYNTGHFVLEEDGNAVIHKIRSFMQKIKK